MMTRLAIAVLSAALGSSAFAGEPPVAPPAANMQQVQALSQAQAFAPNRKPQPMPQWTALPAVASGTWTQEDLGIREDLRKDSKNFGKKLFDGGKSGVNSGRIDGVVVTGGYAFSPEGLQGGGLTIGADVPVVSLGNDSFGVSLRAQPQVGLYYMGRREKTKIEDLGFQSISRDHPKVKDPFDDPQISYRVTREVRKRVGQAFLWDLPAMMVQATIQAFQPYAGIGLGLTRSNQTVTETETFKYEPAYGSYQHPHHCDPSEPGCGDTGVMYHTHSRHSFTEEGKTTTVPSPGKTKLVFPMFAGFQVRVSEAVALRLQYTRWEQAAQSVTGGVNILLNR